MNKSSDKRKWDIDGSKDSGSVTTDGSASVRGGALLPLSQWSKPFHNMIRLIFTGGIADLCFVVIVTHLQRWCPFSFQIVILSNVKTWNLFCGFLLGDVFMQIWFCQEGNKFGFLLAAPNLTCARRQSPQLKY